jgi:hypothetical protein
MSMHEREILDRTRRIETRITKIGRAMGIDVGGGKPIWIADSARIIIPSPNCSVGAIIDAIPVGRRSEEVDVFINDEYMLTLFIDQ